MNFRGLAVRRRLCGLAGTALILLVLALVVDGMIAGGRSDPRRFQLLPGQSLTLSDPMPRGTQRLDDLRLSSPVPGIGVRLVETFSGFWLGGTLWRAEAALAPDLRPGEYDLVMRYAANGTAVVPEQSYRLSVYPDAKAIQAASLSLTTRALGLSPYLLAVCLLPLIILPMAASFALSRRIDRALAEANMAEVYRAMGGGETGQMIFFSLGPEHGLAPGARLEVLDERGERIVGAALVTAVHGEDVQAAMQDGGQVHPGVLVRPA